ncbi:SRPBCC domain-containing protein [Devosia sp.]|uniref:SRPBCC domain-containing protein n=1 Tax=Devosia sp. TaxID=1871048 RepID=UPI0032634F0E
MDDLKITPAANEPAVIISRTLNAPRALVWKAMSQPEHLVRWWGPDGYKNVITRFDWYVGGGYRIETHLPDGKVIVFHGEYLELIAPELSVQTFGVEGMYDGQMATDTATLEDLGNRTLYTIVSNLGTTEARDGMLASGMELGVRQGLLRLDQILIELARAPQNA